jgi:hypothetical protein
MQLCLALKRHGGRLLCNRAEVYAASVCLAVAASVALDAGGTPLLDPNAAEEKVRLVRFASGSHMK